MELDSMSDRDPFLEPIPTVAEGIEKDIDYWTGRLGEGQAGSDWEYSVQTRLAKLNRAKQRLSSNTGSGPLAAQTPRTPKDLDVFISHSSRDEEIAKRLITLIRSALNLPATSIRCTSVDGYRLPTGISTDERLRQEIHDSVAFIALLTPIACPLSTFFSNSGRVGEPGGACFRSFRATALKICFEDPLPH
jgi:hypothetical protein